jgi:DNA-directed RNA polymerase subunit RPC12/RpoP
MSTCLLEGRCLNCGRQMDYVGSVNDDEAELSAGDIAMCINCSHIMLLTDELELRNPTPEELDKISKRDDVLVTLGALAKLRE